MKKAVVLLMVVAMFLCSCDTAVSLGGTNREDHGSDGKTGSGSGSGSGTGTGTGTKYSLTVDITPAGAGTVIRNPNQTTYDKGTSVTLTASPATGYKFSNWSGASSSTSTSTTVAMDANKTVTAVFTSKPKASAVIITLTSWSTRETDAFDNKLDPRISFSVNGYYSGSLLSSESTGALLDKDNVGQSWSGSISSYSVSFSSLADEVRIYATVIEKDPISNDDISPSDVSRFYSPFYSGESGTRTLSGGKSTVTYKYEFVQ